MCPSCGHPLPSQWFDDAKRAVIFPDGRGHYPPPIRWGLLAFFRKHHGQALPFERIYDAMYFGRDDPPMSDTLRVHIKHLRVDIASTPYRIKTLHRFGYIFDREAA